MSESSTIELILFAAIVPDVLAAVKQLRTAVDLDVVVAASRASDNPNSAVVTDLAQAVIDIGALMDREAGIESPES